MQVYKFGGASIATPERMTALLPIISAAAKPLVVVVSALGKTTNALELVAKSAFAGNNESASEQIKEIEKQHIDYAGELLKGDALNKLKQELAMVFTEMHWATDAAPDYAYDYVYDQLVSLGELLSTTIFSHYLQQENMNNKWLDARDLIRTSSVYRDAQVDEAYSKMQVLDKVGTALKQVDLIITQGFIGATDENNSTTLGREGSDYTAALLGSFLGATSVSIWKDVEGLLNADPRIFSETIKIPEISFYEVIEMAYYGAQVIHPKTIKPLRNAGIPLYVKCFLDKDLPGTVIKEKVETPYPPIIVLKRNQVLIQMISKEYDFVTEELVGAIYKIFAKHRVKINIMQKAAISLVVSVDNKKEKTGPLVEELSLHYDVRRNGDAELLTVRHYNENTLSDLTSDRSILLTQKTRRTAQFVLKIAKEKLN